jgi:PKD repeat protein
VPGISGPFLAGDRFRVELAGTTIRYKRNGVTFHTSQAPPPVLPLLMDVSILTPGGSANNAMIAGQLSSNVPPQANAGGSYMTGAGQPLTLSAAGSSDPDGVLVSYAWTFSDGGSATGSTVTRTFASLGDFTATVTVTDDAGASAAASATIKVVPLQSVFWQDVVGASASGSSLTKTSPTAAWNAGAVSKRSLAGSGFVELTATQTNTSRIIGLNHGPNAGVSYEEIEFGIYLYSDGTYWIMESGSFVAGVSGSYQAGNRFRVEVTGTTVRYKRNGVVFHESTSPAQFPLRIDTSILTPGGSVNDAVIAGAAANQLPTPDPGGPYAGFVDEPVLFNGSGSTDPDGIVASYVWAFGDATAGNGAAPSHAYEAAGTYSAQLTVTDEEGGSASASVPVTIAPARPRFSAGDASVNEGNSGTTNALVEVRLTRAPTASLTVGYSTVSATAVAGADYTSVSGMLTFAPGETSKTIAIPVLGDATVEGNEIFYVDLSNAGSGIADGRAVVVIVDEEQTLGCPAAPVAPGALVRVAVTTGTGWRDWVGVFTPGAPSNVYLDWRYVPLPRPSSVTFTAPTAPGLYDVRLYGSQTAGCSMVVDPTAVEGPGGPVLILANGSNLFSRYYAEILRAEGMNAFHVRDIASVSTQTLAQYDVVILGEMPLTLTQAEMLGDWVADGGNLIAMRPNARLHSLLGLSAAGGGFANAYVLVDGPGTGIVNQTIQFHGAADLYAASDATTLATLHSTASAAAAGPAVTLRNVGANGGQAAAFAYDLARSVVYTRQGNPAWVGQNREHSHGNTVLRANDLFFGGSEPDWIDSTKVSIPQADEQQRVLVNLIQMMARDRKPLPRFWYLPRDLKAAIVLTGDDDGGSRTADRLNDYIARSPANCSVADWECIRATAYLIPFAANVNVAYYHGLGFEIGLHTYTACDNWTPTALDNALHAQIDLLNTQMPGFAPLSTERTHCTVWGGTSVSPPESPWMSHASIGLRHGIRMDTNYYYDPHAPDWIASIPGYFTGSGIPMRFAKEDGAIIDVYQATTQMPDTTDSDFIKTLLDNAMGTEGYYGIITANMHMDYGPEQVNQASIVGSNVLLAAAAARVPRVPIVSARQMLQWLDDRAAAEFRQVAWAGTSLTFEIVANRTGLRAMVPSVSDIGPLASISRNGSPVAFTVATIKGVPYAFFDATAGAYDAVYSVNASAPVISGATATVTGTKARITWTTNEVATSRVDYGTSADALSSNVELPFGVTSHGLTLNGLTPAASYFYRVSATDPQGNLSTSPVLSFGPVQ